MKNLLFIGLSFFTVHCKAQSHISLDYTYFGISFNPTKCTDTLDFKIKAGEFINCTAKIFLEDCGGKCKFIVSDKKKVVRATGHYSNGVDTLARYSITKSMDKPKGHSYFQVSLLNYLSPFQTGVWIFYDANGKEIYRTEFHYERFYPIE